MTRDEIRKLIGGYATGSLSASERKLLFDAALDDQELFDELANEHAFKELLETPGAKQRLIAALGPAQPAGKNWFLLPWVSAAAAGAVALAIAMVVVLFRAPQPQEVAQNETNKSQVTQPAVTQNGSTPTDILAKRQAPKDFVPPAKKQAPADLPKPLPAPPPVEIAQDRISVASKSPVPKAEIAPPPPPLSSLAESVTVTVPPEALQSKNGFRAAPQSAAAPPPAATFAGKGGRADLAKAPAAQVAPTSAQFGFDYSANATGSLGIVPHADGFLTILVPGGAVLFPQARVPAGVTVSVAVPPTASELVVTFSSTPGGNTAAPQRLTDPKGTVIDPAPPAARIAVRIPAHP